MTDRYTLMAYKSAIQTERKNIESQREWIKKIGLSFDKTLKRRVANYFSSISCKFDEKAYQKALKEVNQGNTVKSIFKI